MSLTKVEKQKRRRNVLAKTGEYQPFLEELERLLADTDKRESMYNRLREVVGGDPLLRSIFDIYDVLGQAFPLFQERMQTLKRAAMQAGNSNGSDFDYSADFWKTG
jgi:hypothetical protein